MRLRLLLLSLALAGATACDEGPAPGPSQAPDAAPAPVDPIETEPTPEPEPEPEPTPAPEPEPSPAPTPDPEGEAVELGDGEEGRLAPPAQAPEPAALPARPRRRMNLDQLDTAIRQVTGGLGWTALRGGREVSQFDELSATLGKPDYIQNTAEDLEPSALFQKFLDDAARSVCRRRVTLDVESPADDRVVLRFVPVREGAEPDAAQVDANLQHLLRRFHQRRARRDDPELVSWRFQYDASRFSGATGPEAWEALCVALITHPDFYTY